ncbi:phosphoserine phosphatase SerB [Oharaeibacter diazotrophicus]|uniref:Phosphoserine phosphatase n=1 Tax=Oharaeibacter diazotrophicus TaxID=1920512 RepID=A0A4R6RGZ9_9HYPH|nr:phosphoserine phosphatase SerB [Oharaeibacter diazotrophicus]TDP85610.1 phosphoserine phosphatase [Oharaeibacter diazotrophicus]BBE74577.1 phosphoserine phosphatase [Pleomorphomonas sp. SM30]GLS75719.1 phosphoserine phosphatase SerB [Oharaeibacter diazotrophicus]
MTHVAILVSAPATPAVDADAIAAARAALPGGDVRVLAEGIAAEWPVTVADPRATEEILRTALAGRPVDVAVLPAEGRRKRLLVADMDSTMIGQECIDELAAYAGLKEHVAAITERAMRGEIAFEPALRERVALLKGLPLAIVDEVLAERITLTPGGRELVRTMRAAGGYTALVSGGFTVFTGAIRAAIGFDEDRSNTLHVDGGVLAGTVAEPILGKAAKLDSLVELRERLGLAPSETMAVGDGANDLAMVGAAGLGVAFRAKPAVAAEARARVDHGDLTALLYFQGYERAEFVA